MRRNSLLDRLSDNRLEDIHRKNRSVSRQGGVWGDESAEEDFKAGGV